MKQLLRVALLLIAYPVLAGMDCQGTTTPPVTTPVGDPVSPTGDLVIKSVEAFDSKDQLILAGEFGDQQGSVRLGGIRLNVVSWTPSAQQPQQIVCELPRDLSGNVQVQVGTRFSNIAQLTKWELNLLSRTVTAASISQTGQLQIDNSVKLIVRACLNNLLSSTAPSFDVSASVSRVSTADFNASGTLTSTSPPPGHSHSSTSLLRFSPQDFKVYYPGDPIDPNSEKFLIDGLVCGATRGSGGGLKVLFTVRGVYREFQRLDSETTVTIRTTGFSTFSYFDTSIPVTFTFDDGYNIAADSVPARTNSNSTLSWQQASAQSPPMD